MTVGAWTNPLYDAVAEFLGPRTGLVFGPSRRADLEAGTERAMSRARIADLGQYLRGLADGALSLDDLIAEVTVGETYFFREPDQFDFIRREALPEIRRRRGGGHELRVWSAACASGEEAYSLAILLEEEGQPESARVLATDLSRRALARAREAAYGPWSLRGMDADFCRRRFHRHGGRYVLDKAIRERVDFEYLNLALDSYPSLISGAWGMDLILCRNVLMYFDPEAIRRAARRLWETLADGGWLVTAPCDPPLREAAPFELVTTPCGIFYRRAPAKTARYLILPRQAEIRPFDRPEPADPRPKPAPRAEAPAETPLEEACKALSEGRYERAVALTQGLPDDAQACALRVRALANLKGPAEAERAASEAARRLLSPELYFLWGILLTDLGRRDEAVRALRRAIYLDRSSAAAHFALGQALRRRGDIAGARRAYRNAASLCGAGPAEAAVPFSDGESAGRLAEAAKAQLAALEARP